MKIRTLAPIVAFVLVSTVTGSAQGPATQDLQKVIDQYTAAWAKGDAKGVAAVYTDNAIRVDVEGNVLVGRAEIQRSFEQNFAGFLKGTTIRITAGKQVSIRPEVLVVEGTYEVSGAKDPSGKPLTIKGRYLNTMVREGGRLLVGSNASFVPQPSPGAQMSGQ